MDKITESASLYDHLENASIPALLQMILTEDLKVAPAVGQAMPQITALATAVSEVMSKDGRLFYIGAGTSGRLGVLDASEIPPTYGIAPDRVTAVIAGGDFALRHSVEKAEDDGDQGWKDLESRGIAAGDFVIGIAASGTTPYVVGALQTARSKGITTGCIVCNPHSPLAAQSDFPVEVIVGPEFVTGSTRMKAGTAQKMVLNMISTTAMISLGRVRGNRLVDMQVQNDKLWERGIAIIMDHTGLSREAATALLFDTGSVRHAIEKAIPSDKSD